MKYEIRLNLISYVANPYWAEQSTLITIGKAVHPKLGDTKKLQAIEAQCQKMGLTIDDYHRLQGAIKRKWYRLDNNDPTSPIIIPASNFVASLSHGISIAPGPIKKPIGDKDSLRCFISATDLVSNPAKIKADRLDERWFKNPISNERRLQTDEVLDNTQFVGTIEVADHIKQDELKRFLDYTFRYAGIGAARKMGFGRGTVEIK